MKKKTPNNAYTQANRQKKHVSRIPLHFHRTINQHFDHSAVCVLAGVSARAHMHKSFIFLKLGYSTPKQ